MQLIANIDNIGRFSFSFYLLHLYFLLVDDTFHLPASVMVGIFALFCAMFLLLFLLSTFALCDSYFKARLVLFYLSLYSIVLIIIHNEKISMMLISQTIILSFPSSFVHFTLKFTFIQFWVLSFCYSVELLLVFLYMRFWGLVAYFSKHTFHLQLLLSFWTVLK